VAIIRTPVKQCFYTKVKAVNQKIIDSPSIDARELAHYHNLADTWWDATGPFWPLHRLNKVRVDWILAQISSSQFQAENSAQPLQGLSVLDIGCGGGILSESLARLGAQVTGVDVVEKNIFIAKKHAADSNLKIDYQHTTAEALSESNYRFDIVFNMEVVEHVADLSSFMSACNNLVKPGGATFVATINRNWLAGLVAIIGAEYVLGWLPKGTHRYNLLRKPDEIKTHLTQGGLEIQNASGVTVNPITRSMKLTPKLWINYMLYATKPH